MTSHFESWSARVSGVAALLTAVLLALPVAAQTVLRIDGGAHDRAAAVTTDATGNVYVVGQVTQSGVSSFSVTKYASNGVVTWRRAYSGSAGGGTTGYATSVAVNAAGDVYAAGYVYVGGTTTNHLDALLVKFDAAGSELWARRYNGTGNGYDVAFKLALAGEGSVHVGLRSWAAMNFDGVTLTYSAAGALQRVRSFTSAGASDDEIVGIAVDGQNNLIVVGRSSNASGMFGNDVRTIKYGPTGDVVWQRNFTVDAMSDEMPSGMALDPSGGVYVAGIKAASSSPEQEMFGMLLRYDAAGSLLVNITNARAGGQSVAVDVNGDIVVSGLPSPDFAVPLPGVARYTAAGTLLWHTVLPVTGASLFAPFRLVLDDAGNAFVGGTFLDNGGPNRDYMLVKVAPGGGLLWQYRYNGTGNATDEVFDMARDPWNAIYLNGTSKGTSNDDIVTVALPAGFTPPAGPPTVPGSLAATTVATTRVVLQWQDRSSNEDGFRVERCSGAGCTSFAVIGQVASGSTTFTDTGVTKNAKYSYRVRAFNGGGASGPSNVLSVTTPKK